jgi:hypothetical protein
MACVEAKEKEVIISVIENFICDAVGGDPENEDVLNKSIETVIEEFAKIISEAAKKLPDTRFAIICPIQRPRDKWYTENFDEITSLYKESLNNLKLSNITTIDAISLSSQKFETDLVHLTEEAGWTFVDGTLRAAEEFFRAEMIDLEDEETAKDGDPKFKEASSSNTKNMNTKTMREEQLLDKKLRELKEGIRTRKENDNLVFARIREELDMISNAKKEDRLIITGLTSQTPPPIIFEERKK